MAIYDRPPMLDFARAGSAVGATAATLEKTRILAAYFRTLEDEDLRQAAVFMSGRAFSPSQRRTLGLGWSTVSKVITTVSGLDEEQLGQMFRKHSDIGDWAGEALENRTQPEPVTLAEVEQTLEAIRTARAPDKCPARAVKVLARLNFWRSPFKPSVPYVQIDNKVTHDPRVFPSGGAAAAGWRVHFHGL